MTKLFLILRWCFLLFDFPDLDCGLPPVVLNSMNETYVTEYGLEMFYYCYIDHYLPILNATSFSIYCEPSDNGTDFWDPIIRDNECISKFLILMQFSTYEHV